MCEHSDFCRTSTESWIALSEQVSCEKYKFRSRNVNYGMWSGRYQTDAPWPPSFLFFIKFIYFRGCTKDEKRWSATYLSTKNVEEAYIRQAASRVEQEEKGRGGRRGKSQWWGAPVRVPRRMLMKKEHVKKDQGEKSRRLTMLYCIRKEKNKGRSVWWLIAPINFFFRV